MFNLFGKKADIKSINIPTFGWALSETNSNKKQWINPEETMALSLNFFNLPPDLPTLKSVDTLRKFYRNMVAEYNGGIIQVDIMNLKGNVAVKTIFKFAQEPTGIQYISSLTIPFKNCSYVIKIQAPEVGATGMRDAAIGDKLMREGKITLGEHGIENWISDPYDKEFKSGRLMNMSEEAIYDELFPQHPLSQSRKLIKEIEAKIEFSKEMGKLDKFVK